MPKQINQWVVYDLMTEDPPTTPIRQAELEAEKARQLQEARLSADLKTQVTNYYSYHDGFSFCVPTELEAYKAAYIYRSMRTRVEFAPNVGAWLVQIYTPMKG